VLPYPATVNAHVYVGFYSLFSVTEEPRVMSGGNTYIIQYSTLNINETSSNVDKGMRFYFKDGGDQVSISPISQDVFFFNPPPSSWYGVAPSILRKSQSGPLLK
jgi:hypothetical protein